MSFLMSNWLPTLIGAAVFAGSALAVLAIFSAMASKLEERFTRCDEQDIDLQLAA